MKRTRESDDLVDTEFNGETIEKILSWSFATIVFSM